ncbi:MULTISPECIES: replication-associated recombination protein A [Nocardiopsis]|uniref:AAA family ATPase n=2 Tax=Nocardiopsis alba TaxID=53437 RepID=A0A7K2IMH5_9ACTN|nr:MULTISPECIES: replication-associated recombination protein A [Nocardiopsis]AFR09388.1 sigma-54 interaction domain protein [Nocardiopsis alba ATCC BAA-2165]MEC3895570.1 replication-associated recombination protein A [Nocardiopsis sp. LDBS1602]MYR31192.1 AAA family ATPase [Nocardiopsis alba]
MSETLFDDAGAEAARGQEPLAVRMRPRTLDEVVGQRHLLGEGSPLRRLVEDDAPMSVFLWGPPGTGKTTLATVVSRVTRRRFVELSAVNAGVKDVRAVVDEAKRRMGMNGTRTLLFVDEVHRFNKTQQDALLPAVENRWVSFIGATTENPFFSVVSPLLSRSLLLSLESLDDDDVRALVERALVDERGLEGRHTLTEEGFEHLVRLAGGDGRRSLTYLEAAALVAGPPTSSGDETSEERAPVEITAAHVERAVDRHAVRYDRSGDQHYDVISAFIKSMRGSDPDAALHYLARMVEAGEDPRFIARRLVVHASEDVGMADPTALQTAVAAAQAVELIGMPEARINLAQAVVHISLAPKSNAIITAIDEAIADVRAGRAGPVPAHLRDAHYKGAADLGHGQGYRYAHDFPGGVAPQRHAPDGLTEREYYRPTRHGTERRLGEVLQRIKEVLRGGDR